VTHISNISNRVITGFFIIRSSPCSCKDLQRNVSEIKQLRTLKLTSSTSGVSAEALSAVVNGSMRWDGGRSSIKLANDPRTCFGTIAGGWIERQVVSTKDKTIKQQRTGIASALVRASPAGTTDDDAVAPAAAVSPGADASPT
jgi:hypothetical protein